MQANSFFRKEAGIVLKRDGRVGLQLHKNCLPKKKKEKEKKPRPIRAWKLHEQQKDAQANTLQSRVIHCSKMACTSQKLCSWWAQSKKVNEKQNGLMLFWGAPGGCFMTVSCLEHCKEPSALCPYNLLESSCPSPSEPRDAPAFLSCFQEPRAAFDSPRTVRRGEC